ncbi:THUMP-like domain-containing protein [Prevotella sp.]|uniref:THUMP-like domain-containing protein n=1 Tax=Prevotella sp. TaxID=59823 RepID=UPI003DA47D59
MNVSEFINLHKSEDVRKLAFLAAKFPDIDMPWALDQIRGWQVARSKLPSWAEIDGMIYPPHISMEQCSSESTAMYKASLCERLQNECGDRMSLLIDLTGGFGVDFSFMCRNFKKAVYVERQQHLCDIAKHNLDLLEMRHADVKCGDGVDYLHSMKAENAVIYVDPARRDINGAKTYAIEDCTPDVVELCDELVEKASVVIIKLSPMLDWHAAVEKLKYVTEVHVVSVDNECKELLLIMCKDAQQHPVKLFCVNNEDVFITTQDQPNVAVLPISIDEAKCLYEPNASIMKTGCFDQMVSRYNVTSVGKNSHLFISNDEIDDFPGRKFYIISISSFNKKELKQKLEGVKQANITVRNFPLSTDQLRKRLKIKDGGDVYIFATTVWNDQHALIICKKMM